MRDIERACKIAWYLGRINGALENIKKDLKKIKRFKEFKYSRVLFLTTKEKL
jgi:hypothetical protein